MVIRLQFGRRAAATCEGSKLLVRLAPLGNQSRDAIYRGLGVILVS